MHSYRHHDKKSNKHNRKEDQKMREKECQTP